MTQINSQPDHGNKLIDKEGLALSNFQIFMDDIVRQFNLLEQQINPITQLNLFSVNGLPSPLGATGALIYVIDDIGGEIPAFSDGTNWRRVTDRAVVSLT